MVGVIQTQRCIAMVFRGNMEVSEAKAELAAVYFGHQHHTSYIFVSLHVSYHTREHVLRSRSQHVFS